MYKTLIATASFLLSLTAFFFPLAANAEILSIDDPVFGVDSITVDTETGLEWLDVTISFGPNKDEVVASMLGEGDVFEGFRY